MFMPFRSHLARSFDSGLRSNQAIAAIVALAAVAGAVVWLGGKPADVLLAPVHAFALWALVREIDPDHQWSALLAAIAVAVWALLGGPIGSPLPAGGLAVAGRLITATTGSISRPTESSGYPSSAAVILRSAGLSPARARVATLAGTSPMSRARSSGSIFSRI